MKFATLLVFLIMVSFSQAWLSNYRRLIQQTRLSHAKQQLKDGKINKGSSEENFEALGLLEPETEIQKAFRLDFEREMAQSHENLLGQIRNLSRS